MSVASPDLITMTDLELTAYERALEPKKLVMIRRALRRIHFGVREGVRRGRGIVQR